MSKETEGKAKKPVADVVTKKPKSKPKSAGDKKEKGKFTVGKVSVSMGMTINIGNYESYRADSFIELRADITDPSKVDPAQLADMYEFGWDKVKTELRQKISEVRNTVKNAGKKEG